MTTQNHVNCYGRSLPGAVRGLQLVCSLFRSTTFRPSCDRRSQSENENVNVLKTKEEGDEPERGTDVKDDVRGMKDAVSTGGPEAVSCCLRAQRCGGISHHTGDYGPGASTQKVVLPSLQQSRPLQVPSVLCVRATHTGSRGPRGMQHQTPSLPSRCPQLQKLRI